jgi:DNA (cytosine-5)-methyltransferase 1
MPDAIDVFGFAGGMTLGMVKAGWTLVGKRETSEFGVANCLANRHLLGAGWDVQTNLAEWEPLQVDMVFGNPPCSGFSLMSSKSFRGIDSSVNACMWQLVEYASRCDPSIVAFESVQGAFTVGRPLMQALRARLEELTSYSYELYHVKHDAYALGGCAIRRRYFFVVSRVPFGVERPSLNRYATWWDAIGDLEGLDTESWDDQPVKKEPSWWARRDGVRRADGLVDGHVIRPPNDHVERCLELLCDDGIWEPGEGISIALRRYYEKHGKLPPRWGRLEKKVVGNDFDQGFYAPFRWPKDRPGRVITGGGLDAVVHPTEPRLITHREAARTMGFPDEWRLGPLRDVNGLSATHGKGITVHCGRWLGEWAIRSLDGEPGEFPAEEIGEREWLIEVKKPPTAELEKMLYSAASG